MGKDSRQGTEGRRGEKGNISEKFINRDIFFVGYREGGVKLFSVRKRGEKKEHFPRGPHVGAAWHTPEGEKQRTTP